MFSGTAGDVALDEYRTTITSYFALESCSVVAFSQFSWMPPSTAVWLVHVGFGIGCTMKYVAPKSAGGYAVGFPHPSPLLLVHVSPEFAFAW